MHVVNQYLIIVRIIIKANYNEYAVCLLISFLLKSQNPVWRTLSSGWEVIGCRCDANWWSVKDLVKEFLKELVKFVKELIKELVKEFVKELVKEFVKELVKEFVKELKFVNELVKEFLNELVKEFVKELVKQLVNEQVKEFVKELVKQLVKVDCVAVWCVVCGHMLSSDTGCWSFRGTSSLAGDSTNKGRHPV